MSFGQFSIKYGEMFMKQFPQRLKDALLFIDSSSYCKCLIHFSLVVFHCGQWSVTLKGKDKGSLNQRLVGSVDL